jgi:hypothetical protein
LSIIILDTFPIIRKNDEIMRPPIVESPNCRIVTLKNPNPRLQKGVLTNLHAIYQQLKISLKISFYSILGGLLNPPRLETMIEAVTTARHKSPVRTNPTDTCPGFW